jgi:hypothetical protein
MDTLPLAETLTTASRTISGSFFGGLFDRDDGRGPRPGDERVPAGDVRVPTGPVGLGGGGILLDDEASGVRFDGPRL